MTAELTSESIMVSIICLAFNHEKFIRDALEGFVNQKTDFAYEVLIHDDASQDGTADIIREYEKKYPDIIKPIYQTVNQYSQGVLICDEVLFPKARGKYIAMCEGDDYWTDCGKLQKQVDILEKNPQYSACTHCVSMVDYRSGEENVINPTDQDYIFGVSDLILWRDKKYHTSSLMLRKEFFVVPSELRMRKVGDYPRAVYCALNGQVYYMRDIMAKYRYFTPGSWSSRNEGENERIKQNLLDRIDFLERLNKYCKGKFRDEILYASRQNECKLCQCNNDYRTVVRQYKDLIMDLDSNERRRIYLRAYFPVCFRVGHKIKSVFKKSKFLNVK